MINKTPIQRFTQIRDTYTVDNYLGQGAFGAVYKVRHKFLGIQALKIFHPGSISKEQEADFFNEAYILTNLTHENVVRVYEANTFILDGIKHCYIAMEFIDGLTLASFIEEKVRLPVDLAINIQKDICRGLAQAHKLSPPVVHRDVKPQNVLLGLKNKNMIAKVSDFGLAKHVDPITRITTAGGTLAFMPPEGFWNYEAPASDVFSAGIVFYIMLAGVPPFAMPPDTRYTNKKDIEADIIASRSKKPEPPSKFNSQLDKAIDKIVLKALEPDIKNRYQNAEEFFKVIEEYQQEREVYLDSEIQEALKLGSQYSTLKEAIKLLEEIISRQPEIKKRYLEERYKQTLKNWKRGMIL
ncbi:MAG: serine/threonine-protein kinase [Candidatus Omnitrophota bacterium]|jgi:serine/threonine-protein kinase